MSVPFSLKNILEKFFPLDFRPFVFISFLVGASCLIGIGVAKKHVLSGYFALLIVVAWVVLTIAFIVFSYRRWDRFLKHKRRVFWIASPTLILVVVLLFGTSVEGGVRALVILGSVFLALAFVSWILFFLVRRSERITEALLKDREGLSKRVFGTSGGLRILPVVLSIGMMSGMKFMNPRRRTVFFSGLVVVSLLFLYVLFVLVSNKLWATVLIFVVGSILADLLLESIIVAEVAEKKAVEIELDAARTMQMGLMPKEDPTVTGFDISGVCLPANEVGGDFFDYLWLDAKKTKFGIAVADVSGKAMKAAITAVMTSGMIYREVGGNDSPKSIMRKINKPMYTKLDSRMFTALSFAVIDTKKKELRFSNAGQAYPVLKRGKDVVPLEVKGARLPLGVKEDVLYGEMVVKLKKGDTVIFYTDGIPEAKNEKDEFYGFDRFKEIVGGIDGASAKETRDRILEDVKSFTGKSPQYDDMTVVVVNVT